MQPYLAMDIETTGLNPESCQVLELAAVVETADWRTPVEELPRFRALCDPGEIRGEPTALAMNAGLLREIAALRPRTGTLEFQIIDLSEFIEKHMGKDSVTIAGKNFPNFDYQFLRRSELWHLIRHKHRFIDVGNLWWNPVEDTCLPTLAECCERAGVAPRQEHNAVEDCLSVIECIRANYGRRV